MFTTKSFLPWLADQVGRKDRTGQLARDYVKVRNAGLPVRSHGELLRLIEKMGSDYGIESFDLARDEWRGLEKVKPPRRAKRVVDAPLPIVGLPEEWKIPGVTN